MRRRARATARPLRRRRRAQTEAPAAATSRGAVQVVETDRGRSGWLAREMAEPGYRRLWGAASGPWREDPHPSEILARRSEPNHRLGELYDHMFDTDPELLGFFEKRAASVMRLPRRVVPGGPSPKDLEAADLCRYVVGETGIETTVPSVRFFGSVLKKRLIDEAAKGIAVDENVWEELPRGPWAGAWVPVAIYDRPMRRFAFQSRALRVRRFDKGPQLVTPPGAKFLVGQRGSTDSPWGRGLLDACYWPWWLRKQGLRFWATYIEKYGQPSAVAEYEAMGDEIADEELQDQAFEVIDAIQNDYGVAIPSKLMKLSFLEAARSSDPTYASFYDQMGRAMARLIQHELGTSGLRPGTGSYASDQVADKVRQGPVIDDSDAAVASIGELFRWITDWNYGPHVACPRLEIDTLDLEQRRIRMDGISSALGDGVDVAESDYRNVHLVRQPREGEAVVRRRAPAPAPPPPSTTPPETDP